MKKGKISILLVFVLVFTLAMSSCGENKETGSKEKITIVQQYGMAYAPFKIMEKKGFLEANYNGDLDVEYTVLNSGSTITESFAAGTVDVGAMGLAPAITGASSGVGFKICSNLAAQPHKIMTNNPKIKSLKDIGKDDKIALVNIGSFQHILLGMAAKEQLGNAHALDENISAMAHPDGMTALLNKQVACQLTTSPYTFKEADEKGISEVEALESVWPSGNTFIVACASQDLHDNHPDLYEAVVKGIQDAIDFINNNPEEAAEMLCGDEDVPAKTMLKWLKDPACLYSSELKGAMDMAKFMAEEGFLEVAAPKAISDLAFENVKGE